jgi:transposase
MAKKTKKQWKYPPEFVEKALATWEKLRAQGKLSTEAAKMVGVAEQTLYTWKNLRDGTVPPSQQARAKKPPSLLAARQPERPRALVAKRERPSDPAVPELMREIASLREENAVLTATVLMFARRRS